MCKGPGTKKLQRILEKVKCSVGIQHEEPHMDCPKERLSRRDGQMRKVLYLALDLILSDT